MFRFLPGLVLAVLAAPALAATPIDETRPLHARGEIEISNLKGSIEVRTWDHEEVRITGSLGDGVERLEIGDGGRELSVHVRYPRNSRDSEPTSLVLQVPRRASVEVHSVAAHVDVQGVAGRELEIESVSGRVIAVGAPDEANIESVSGDLRLNLNSRDVEVDTVSGNIMLRGRLSGKVSAESVSGNVDIDTRGEALARLESSTVSGDATLRAAIANGGRFSFESVSGDVRMTLPAASSARVEARTYSGDISAPGGDVNRKRLGPGASLEHVFGSGSGSISVETFSGDVSLRFED